MDSIDLTKNVAEIASERHFTVTNVEKVIFIGGFLMEAVFVSLQCIKIKIALAKVHI